MNRAVLHAITTFALFFTLTGDVHAQESKANVPPDGSDPPIDGAGIGVSANTTDAAFGLALPIGIGDSFRLEPTLLFGVDGGGGDRVTDISRAFSEDGGTGNLFSVSTSVLRVGPSLGLIGVFGSGSDARALLGGEVGAVFANASTTTTVVQVPSGDTSERTDSTYLGANVFVRPVFGGEMAVSESVVIGLRAGPSIEIFVPDGDADSQFSLSGFGRIDIIYDF